MPSGLLGIAGVLALLLGVGGAIGLARRDLFSGRWLAIAAALVLAYDAVTTRFYGAMPDMVPAAEWNWQGKLMALALVLGLAALPAFGWRATGLTLRQRPGSLRAALPVAALYLLFFLGLAIAFPDDPASRETIAFQLTLPGLVEEPFYRGLLLLALDRAFAGRVRWLGVDWGWGALLSSALFGLDHGFGWSHGGFAFDPAAFALTAVPALVAVWLRLRTGSLLLLVLLHNFGNAIGLII